MGFIVTVSRETKGNESFSKVFVCLKYMERLSHFIRCELHACARDKILVDEGLSWSYKGMLQQSRGEGFTSRFQLE